jgi:hypothetical protein
MSPNPNFSEIDRAIFVLLIFFIFHSGLWLRGRTTRATSKRGKEPLTHQPVTSRDASTCRQVIAGTFESTQGPNMLSPHESRAVPNHRLKLAFGIDNAFTRMNSSEVASFVTTARNAINLQREDWVAVSHFARNTATDWIQIGFSKQDNLCGIFHHGTQNPDTHRINVTSMVQVLTLRCVFLVIFRELDQSKVGDLSLLKLARSINRVWIASKLSPDDQQVPRFEDDAQLQEALFEIFGIRNVSPSHNPLNLILPSFETMWRVVLRAVLEIGAGSGAEHPAWKTAIIAFAMNTTKEQFERNPYSTRSSSKPFFNKDDLAGDALSVKSSPSARDLVLETLRLYVPTRRVHRAYRWSHEMGSHEILSADIEGCHLQPEIWRDDANEFNPNRWSALTPEQKQAFLPFGCVPFECPAKPTFGPRMIGLLAGSLLAGLESRSKMGWTLECADKNVLAQLKSGERLDPGRNAYGSLYLVQPETKGASRLK